jgi:osmotically-inducible protein OsmY
LDRATAPITIGTRIRFKDRWQGRLSALEVSDDWEVLNVHVTSGIAFFKRSVKLPFSSVTSWQTSVIDIEAVSFHAFNREVPPVAAPARLVSAATRVAHQGTKVRGLIIGALDRRASELLVSRGASRPRRISTSSLQFEGETMTLGEEFETLTEYRTDQELESLIRDAIADDEWLTPDDKRSLSVHVDNGTATVGGNVRVETTREYVYRLVEDVPGLVSVKEETVADLALETSIGLALDKSGLQRRARVFPRSNLGRVTLFGTASSPQQAADVTRAVEGISGVREVESRLALAPA